MKSPSLNKGWFIAGGIFVLLLVAIVIWASQQRWLPHKEDHFKNRQVAAIWIMKAGPQGQYEIDKKIEDPAKVAWFKSRLDQGYVSGFSGFFGTLGPAEFFVDEKGDVIAAAYYRIPEYRVCFFDVTKTDAGYVLKNWNGEYGIYDQAYIQEMAKLTDAP